MGRRAAAMALMCGGAAGFATVAKPALRSPGACVSQSVQRRAAPASLMMNANNLDKIVVCTGPTCTKNGGGKKLKKMVEEMAAPLGVRMRAPPFTASTDCR
jgi:hypothetical protein